MHCEISHFSMQAPVPRAMHSATAMGTSLVVFGGASMATGRPVGDLAILDTSKGEPFEWQVKLA